MVRDFVGFAGLSEDDLGPVGSRSRPLQRPVHEDVLRALDDERAKLANRAALATTIARRGDVDEPGPPMSPPPPSLVMDGVMSSIGGSGPMERRPASGSRRHQAEGGGPR